VKSRTFVDEVTLHATAGNGGNGCVGFRREKFVPKGGPDGGDGGRGGHVILEGSRDTDSLIGIYFQPIRRAEHGGHGMGRDAHGRNGRDLTVLVPCGTVVLDPETGEEIGEVLEHGQQLIVARGGKGGLGNTHWKSSTHQTPLEHTNGVPGDERTYRLELKLIANVGLVGLPNAGKSSLISRLSDAHPKIAAYPFTTLNPIIGTIMYEDYLRVTVADIPGLIRGAHEGAGLGHGFLRHIERSAILVYVIDMAGTDGRLPHDDYRTLREELKLHRASMLDRPSIVVANKMDVPEAAENLKVFKRKTRTKPLLLSAMTGDGVPKLRQAIRELWDAGHSASGK
jgi:GTPase